MVSELVSVYYKLNQKKMIILIAPFSIKKSDKVNKKDKNKPKGKEGS